LLGAIVSENVHDCKPDGVTMSWLSSYRRKLFNSKPRSSADCTHKLSIQEQASPPTSCLKSIAFDELESLFSKADDLDDPGAISLLSEYYLDIDLGEVPSDPYGSEYLQFMMDLYSRLSGRKKYNPNIDELYPEDVDTETPHIYQHDSKFLGSYLESIGIILRRLDVRAGDRLIEFGAGSGQILLHLAKMGCDTTAIDVDPAFLSLIEKQAASQGVKVHTVLGTFLDGTDLGKFDRVFFHQAFHHGLPHMEMLAHCRKLLKPNGKIMLFGEPIVEPGGHWGPCLPYPWGLRLDALSLLAIKRHGWMELGYQTGYFHDACRQSGLQISFEPCEHNGLSSTYTLQQSAAAA